MVDQLLRRYPARRLARTGAPAAAGGCRTRVNGVFRLEAGERRMGFARSFPSAVPSGDGYTRTDGLAAPGLRPPFHPFPEWFVI
jgi:hypothetical protein